MRSNLRILLPALLSIFVSACGGGQDATGGKTRPSVFVTIEPLRYFADHICGDLADVHVLVAPGQSPATYEPSARQMAELAEADLLFTVGVPMEEQLVPRIRRSFRKVEVVPTQAAMKERFIQYESFGSRGGGVTPGHEHGSRELDPHGWLDPREASRIAFAIYQALARVAPEHEEQFSSNYRVLDDSLTSLYSEVAQILVPVRGMEMVVFHPAYGHFADAFHLEQVAIETGGFTPGSKHLADVIEFARERGVRAIFVQPQFSSTTADAVAAAIGAQIVTLDPLAYDYPANLRRMAREIVKALSTP